MKSKIKAKAQANIQIYNKSENYDEFLQKSQPTKEDLLTATHFDNEVTLTKLNI